MEPMITRIGYLDGASPQRPIEPVHSLMEEAIRRQGMEDLAYTSVNPPVIVKVEEQRFTCPDCGIEHDGICQFGQTRRHATCAECFEKRRMTSHKAHRDYVKELIRKDKEAKKQAEQVVFEPDKPVEIVSEMDLPDYPLRMSFHTEPDTEIASHLEKLEPLTEDQEKYYEAAMEMIKEPVFRIELEKPKEKLMNMVQDVLKQNQQILDMNAELLKTLTMPMFLVDTDKLPSERINPERAVNYRG